MLLRQFCLCNNLPMHIRENTDFPRQKPRQLPNAEANFQDCIYKYIHNNLKCHNKMSIKIHIYKKG